MAKRPGKDKPIPGDITPEPDAASQADAADMRSPRVALVNLGCSKNTVDSEVALAELMDAGWDLAVDEREADLVLVNTCAFIASAREESFSVLDEMLAARDEEGYPRIIALGCMSERLRDSIRERLPALDGIFGFDAYGRLHKLCMKVLRGEQVTSFSEGVEKRKKGKGTGKQTAEKIIEGPRLLTTPSYAYLRLAEGCDNRCAYCAIPLIRGGLRSRSSHKILKEAEDLVAQGMRELVLVAQDPASYGVDRYNKSRLAPLLHDLLAATGDAWIRLMYVHPAHLQDEVIDLLASEPRLCSYLDMPIQHINSDVLEAMGRHYDRARVETLLASLRQRNADVVLRTSILVGFPGESDAAFEELLTFVKDGHFQHLGAFGYSPEEGTRAKDLPDQLPPEEIARRVEAVMLAQQEVATAWRASRSSTTAEVLVDTRLADGTGLARSQAEAPEVDPCIWIANCPADAGERLRVTLTPKPDDPYDLCGTPEATA